MRGVTIIPGGSVTEVRPIERPASWSDGELATLAELAESFVRGGALRRAVLAAQAIDQLEPSQGRQLRLVLRLVESRLANLAIGGGATAFRDLDPAARERYLLRWGSSRLALRRSAYQAFKKLLCFLAYADPGEMGTNSLWETIGYRPHREAVSGGPTPIRPVDLPATGDPVRLDADVVIVGSGAGGGVMAAELARAGRSVVVLEAGPFIPETEMPTDELTAFDRMYLDHGLTSTWDGAISILAGAVVGGGTTVNWSTCIPVQGDVRAAWAHDHGLDGMDGPEFEADRAVLERELGVQGPPNIPPKDAAILRGAASLGWEVAEIQRNGVDCGDCGSCPFGCPRGAKQSGLRAHLADAWRLGARVVPDARVERVLGAAAGSATGVEARLGDGRRLHVAASQVVLAAGALRTPGILERSGVAHPGVGRNLHLHPVSVVAAQFREPVDMWSGTNQAARSLEFLAPRGIGGSGFVIESAPGHPGLIALAFPWQSTDEFAGLMNRVRRFAPFIAVTRDLGSGRVRSTRTGGTRIDYRVGSTEVDSLRRGLVAMARLGRAAGADQLVALGVPAAWFGSDGHPAGGQEAAFEAYLQRLARFDFSPNRGMVFSAHQMGTARVGREPGEHPCDERGRVRLKADGRLVRGLYVADTSLFPTAIGVNPMMTAMVLSRRVSRTVIAEG